jgi:hypothetical protein
MKKRKLEKLTLSKETVRHLEEYFHQAVGGITHLCATYPPQCATIYTACYTCGGQCFDSDPC